MKRDFAPNLAKVFWHMTWDTFISKFAMVFLHMTWELCADLLGRYFLTFLTDGMGMIDQISQEK